MQETKRYRIPNSESLVFRPPDEIEAVRRVAVHRCEGQAAVFEFGEAAEQFFYMFFVVVAADDAFVEFEDAVFAVLVFEFFVARYVAFVGVEQEVVDVEDSAGAEDAADFGNHALLLRV